MDTNFDFSSDELNKAGYNQAQRITETLAMLRNSYVSAMIEEDYSSALKVSRRVVDIISAKIIENDLKDLNTEIYRIKENLPKSEETYVSQGYRFYRNPRERIQVEKDVENLWRKIELLQDKHGYGMLSEEDYGL